VVDWRSVVIAAALASSACGGNAQTLSARRLEPPTSANPSQPGDNVPLSPRNASYDIAVRLEPGDRSLHGRETIHWRNISAHPTTELQFHLYWNAWRNADSTWMRERRLGGNSSTPRADAWGWTDVRSLRVTLDRLYELSGRLQFIAPDDGNAADKTVAAVSLPRAVLPQETVVIELEWSAKIPRPFARTGYIDDYYFFGQWFPKLGVLEDTGWNTHQFHSSTEFYSDYGIYDVRMTVPRGYVVGASGVQIGVKDNADGTAVHEFHGDDIHDFAWTASPHFLERTQTFAHPTLPPVKMRLLLQPEHAGQAARHFAAAEAALKYYGEWFGAYPYGNLTIVDPAFQSASGGMEYPTLFTAGTRWIAPEGVTVPESVTVHEAGHQWWYGAVGSNEFEHAWMDEGINQFSEARADEAAFTPNYLVRRYFGGFIPWVFRDIRQTRQIDEGLANYRIQAESDAEATPSFRYWPSTGGNITYYKTALWLHTLERSLGWPTLQRIMSTYFEQWKFRHPQPADFFQAVSEGAGRDMTPFFDQVYRGSNTFDYGVQTLVSTGIGAGRFRTTVVARRFGEATFPVDVVTTFTDGSQAVEHWDGVARRAMYAYDRTSRARSVQVDPKRILMLDVNYTNNSRTLEPRAAEASLKWSLKWMAWLQDTLLTYAFLV
jgi:aminopeptidase N